MAKTRSPRYPTIGLKEAIEKAKAVYEKDYQNQISRNVVAQHMGYNGLNGKSLGVLSAVNKFGLLEGRGDETRVTDLAVKIIAHPTGSPERAQAIMEAAASPDLFKELDSRFPNARPSEAAIRSYLLTQKFIPSAADIAVRSYLETKDLVKLEVGSYTPPADGERSNMQETVSPNINQMVAPPATQTITPDHHQAGNRKAIFALTEGDVIITFPEELSPESVDDLASYIDIFLKKARREAGIA